MSYGMDYGGGGGFGDGGPSPSQSRPGTGGGGGGGTGRKSYDEQTIQPVTVQMCLQSHPNDNGSGEQLADGRQLYHVKIVGAVRTFEDFSTNCLYGIEDGTGLIDVKQWIDNNDCTVMQQLRSSCAKENIYVTIVGQIKDYDGKKTIVADSVRPIQSGNEITHHMLEVVYAGEMSKRMNSSMYSMSKPSGLGFGAGAVAKGAPIQQQQYGNNTTGSNSLRDTVLDFIRTEGLYSEAGANVPACIQRLDGKYTSDEIRNIIEDLASEGHIYSTIDENNYKFAM